MSFGHVTPIEMVYLTLAVAIIAWWVGRLVVQWHFYRLKKEIEEGRGIIPSPPPGLPPGGLPTSQMVAAQLQQTFAEPFDRVVKKDASIYSHYSNLVFKERNKHGHYSYDATGPVTVVGPRSGRVYKMDKGDTITTDIPLSINDLEEELFGERCRFCGTIKVYGKSHCPNCGGSY